MDYGHKMTEQELLKLQREISALYSKEYAEVQREINSFLREYAREYKTKRLELQQGIITKDQFRNWQIGKVSQNEKFERLRIFFAERMVNARVETMKAAERIAYIVFSLNYNYTSYELELLGYDLVKTIYDNGKVFELVDEHTIKRLLKKNPSLLPKPSANKVKEYEWNKKKISTEVTDGILRGEPVKKVAARIKGVTEMDSRAALRAARTAVTGAQNSGRQESYNNAAENGIRVRKRWIAAKDTRTRESHALLDGQIVDFDKPFQSAYGDIRYPADPTAHAGDIWNCRCTMATAERADLEIEPRKMRVYNPETGESEVIDKLSYTEWVRRIEQL